jgi:hypothetical protein
LAQWRDAPQRLGRNSSGITSAHGPRIAPIGGLFALKERFARPFLGKEYCRERLKEMAVDSVGSVSAPTGAQYSVAVSKKQQSQQEVEGQESVQLIQSASAPLATSGDVGTKLNFTA